MRPRLALLLSTAVAAALGAGLLGLPGPATAAGQSSSGDTDDYLRVSVNDDHSQQVLSWERVPYAG